MKASSRSTNMHSLRIHAELQAQLDDALEKCNLGRQSPLSMSAMIRMFVRYGLIHLDKATKSKKPGLVRSGLTLYPASPTNPSAETQPQAEVVLLQEALTGLIKSRGCSLNDLADEIFGRNLTGSDSVAKRRAEDRRVFKTIYTTGVGTTEQSSERVLGITLKWLSDAGKILR